MWHMQQPRRPLFEATKNQGLLAMIWVAHALY
jgi:hypothetical protein